MQLGSPRARFAPLPFAAFLGIAAATLNSGWLFRHLHDWALSAALALGGLIGWIIFHRRYRRFTDTPEAPIAAAPQGYVRISGIGRVPGGVPLTTPLDTPMPNLPCLWFRLEVEERDSDNNWRRVREEQSDDSFLLEDEDGQRCVISPEHATVITSNIEKHNGSDWRSTLWLLIPGTRLHALGYFVTRNAGVDRPSIAAEVRDKLGDWKAAGETKRFDLDGNGEIDMQEWELARAAARREVMQERSQAADAPDEHSLIRPPDGRDFIITDQDPTRTARRLRWQAWAWLLLFFAGVAGLSMTVGR